MSLLCARCHTHKYDPVPHEEYYRLMAFFNSTAESPMDGNSYDYAPNVLAPGNVADWDRFHKLKSIVETDPGPPFTAPEKTLTPLQFSAVETKIEVSHDVLEDQSVAIDTERFTYLLTSDSFHGTLEGFQLDVIPDERVIGPVGTVMEPEKRDRLLRQVKVTITVPDTEPRELVFRTATTGFSEEDHRIDGLIAPTPSDGWKVANAPDTPQQLLLILKHEETIPEGATLAFELIHDDPEHQLGRFKLSAADKVIDRGPRGQLISIKDSFTTTLIAQEGEHRDTFVLERGEYNLPIGEPLNPGVISVAGPLPEGAPQNRLGLAQWLTSPDQPLVARVLVNRMWQQVFGYGLVRTPEEFGLQGDQPSHPELLDWLAITLHESGWDRRAMLKRMVMSQTFRQSSRFRDDVSDPENNLFARGPSFRLDAEVLRDQNLWVSGLLDPTMGGEGVKPYQPAGMWFALAHPGSNTKNYVADEGPRLYRRSLYVYWKRTSPHPMMTLFDAPNRETSCVRRSRSNTPLQSLALFNETQRVETARMLAERLLKEADSNEHRLDLLFQLLTCQPPSDVEASACNGLLESMLARYQAAPEDAKHLLAIGEMPRDESLDLAQHAAWTQVATTLLASDRALLLY